jgi:hypothetical protein
LFFMKHPVCWVNDSYPLQPVHYILLH